MECRPYLGAYFGFFELGVSLSKVQVLKHVLPLHIKGALSRGSRGFLAQTILKLVVTELIHSEHYL